MPHEWKLVKESIVKDDGRYLVYYHFPKASDLEKSNQPADKSTAATELQARAGEDKEGR